MLNLRKPITTDSTERTAGRRRLFLVLPGSVETAEVKLYTLYILCRVFIPVFKGDELIKNTRAIDDIKVAYFLRHMVY